MIKGHCWQEQGANWTGYVSSPSSPLSHSPLLPTGVLTETQQAKQNVVLHSPSPSITNWVQTGGSETEIEQHIPVPLDLRTLVCSLHLPLGNNSRLFIWKTRLVSSRNRYGFFVINVEAEHTSHPLNLHWQKQRNWRQRWINTNLIMWNIFTGENWPPNLSE